jgi:hypothetical protein
MRQPGSMKELVDQLQAQAQHLRNWLGLIEAAIISFEHAVKQIQGALPDIGEADQRRFLTAWAAYHEVTEDCLADGHRAIAIWAQALTLRG